VPSQGIGARLIREGLRDLDFDYCVVLGDPHYYQRFGFEKASRFGIRNEYGVDEELMVLCFSDSTVAGVVQ
jgi:putative acetyltransferase